MMQVKGKTENLQTTSTTFESKNCLSTEVLISLMFIIQIVDCSGVEPDYLMLIGVSNLAPPIHDRVRVSETPFNTKLSSSTSSS